MISLFLNLWECGSPQYQPIAFQIAESQ